MAGWLPARFATTPLRNGRSMQRYDTSASATEIPRRTTKSGNPLMPDDSVTNTRTGLCHK